MVTMPRRRLGQQPRYFGDRDADQGGDFCLALLLEVVQLGNPAQQLALFVEIRIRRRSEPD
jgi:hypothetical protein